MPVKYQWAGLCIRAVRDTCLLGGKAQNVLGVDMSGCNNSEPAEPGVSVPMPKTQGPSYPQIPGTYWMKHECGI